MKNRTFNPTIETDTIKIVCILDCKFDCIHYNKCSRAFAVDGYTQWFCGCFKNKHGIKKNRRKNNEKKNKNN